MKLRIKIALGILLVSGIHITAQKIPSEKPKLVVGITVSGMRYDYLSAYWDKFGEDGFKKMAGGGTHCKNARYDQLITESAVGYAIIGTGARPDAHGIVADYWYDRLEDEVRFSIEDPTVHAIYSSDSNGHTSPSKMLSRTLSDELRIVSQFQSKVIGISMDPLASVLQSGHTSNAAYWFDTEHGIWTTSTYYMDSLPAHVEEFNQKNYKDIYCKKIWDTYLPIGEYTASMLDNNSFEEGFKGQITFPYDLNRIGDATKKTDYSVLLSTPYGNTYTTDFAINTIVNEELGQGDVTDWINISFNATKYLSKRYSTWSVEVEDMYLRLDQDIAHLLTFLDEQIGLENTLIYLTADNAIADDPRFLAEHRVPSGYFNYISTISLLKSYLNAIYGQGNWVNLYYANQVYLNHQLIEDSRLSLEEFQDRVANFLIQFSGVSNALPAYILQRTNFTEGIFKRIQNSYNQKRSGDVIIYLTPGWVEKGSEYRESLSEFNYDAHVPLIFYGWNIKRVTIPDQVSPLDIVPTVAYFLEISVPENASGKVITGMLR
ncbi:MAG: alkaline phosphatase family protein [Bacteroidales bacterium]|jgi:predicted AlkP superfamily pyrophosphatase or phosphodiesterase|nr:alkaline phosphatase family protein [Bacteroidales bacterium]